MRTTVRLGDDLLIRAKRHTAAERRTERVALPTFRGAGVRPGVDLDDSAALLDLMEGPGDPLPTSPPRA